jgi:hypothetical protein
MGIKNLNKFLRENCSHRSIKKQSLSKFENKTIVIDTSIYLYRFMSENALMENMYLLISIMLSFKIVPVFIFDGKPPPEKQALLKQRRIDKKAAEHKYQLIQSRLQLNAVSDDDKTEMLLEMETLRRQFIRITEEDVQCVKRLMDAYGVAYYDAPGEADQICAYMVKSGMAWACLSDDMDMFLYGCPYVLRNISLINKTILVYDTSAILSELNMSDKAFREVMILSGTDYNHNLTCTLDDIIALYTQYSSSQTHIESGYEMVGFYEWLIKNTDKIADVSDLQRVYRMFDIDSAPFIDGINRLELYNKCIHRENICYIMEKEGFIFT